MSTNYPFKATEQKWQQQWQQLNCFATNLQQTDRLKNYYVLEMLPYPSGKVHMGHVRNYTIGDVLARYKRAKGFNVLYPMGWDAFGLPAENAAKENNVHPKEWTEKNIKDMKAQLQLLGFSWDWSREVATNSANYTKAQQQIFIDLYKHNLAYKKESWVNWDPVENTVLANEQVVDGKGWRSGAEVIQKQLSQWFLKITDFAEDLLDGLKTLNGWSDNIKNIQSAWIGKSTGANIVFKLNNGNSITIYTTKPHTIFGASFIALSVKNNISLKLAEENPEIKAFVDKYKNIKNIEEELKDSEKEGILTNIVAINPINNTQIPVYIANYVLDYGTGAVFGCPAHDSRDYEFAKKYNLNITQVITPTNTADKNNITLPYEEDEGVIVNSSFLNNLTQQQAFTKVIEYLEQNNIGNKATQYKLKDWGVSRQRYWGTPIPIIYCNSCGVVTEKPENLPILLPDDVDFSTASNPLDNHPTFKHCTCSQCGKPATRETDTLDTFMESAWYFISYISFNTNHSVFNKQLLNSFLPVNHYIGGIEHAIMHLLYSRFIFKALIKMNYLDNHLNEPFLALLTQGMITHKTYKTKDTNKWVFPNEVIEQNNILIHKPTNQEVVVGKVEKMSKSKKNVVDPVLMCSTYGADTARLFVLSDSPPEKGLEWSEEGLDGIYKFINRLWRVYNNFASTFNGVSSVVNPANLDSHNLSFYIKVQQYINQIENYTATLHFNKTISLCRELINLIEENANNINANLLKYSAEVFLQLINPVAPHITEELWEILGNTTCIAKTSYPVYNVNYLQLQDITVAIQINGKTKGSIVVNKDITKNDLLAEVTKLNNIAKHINNQELKKVIYVPKKIINIVL